MHAYRAPLRDMRFVLHGLLGAEGWSDLPGYEEATTRALRLGAGGGSQVRPERACAVEPPRRRGRLHLREWRRSGRPRGSVSAYGKFRDGGWTGVVAGTGMGRPGSTQAAQPGDRGDVRQRQPRFQHLSRPQPRCLPCVGKLCRRPAAADLPAQLTDGTWSGTMCLTEPQCGTDLGLIRTKAMPGGGRELPDQWHQDLHQCRRARPDREHRPPGAGQAARRSGRDATASACSLVPKFLPVETPDGWRPGARNGVRCAGPRAQDGHPRLGYLHHAVRPGLPAGWSATAHQGMAAMFAMMNAARLGVGPTGPRRR